MASASTCFDIQNVFIFSTTLKVVLYLFYAVACNKQHACCMLHATLVACVKPFILEIDVARLLHGNYRPDTLGGSVLCWLPAITHPNGRWQYSGCAAVQPMLLPVHGSSWQFIE